MSSISKSDDIGLPTKDFNVSNLTDEGGGPYLFGVLISYTVPFFKFYKPSKLFFILRRPHN